jgi:hypothetical protein
LGWVFETQEPFESIVRQRRATLGNSERLPQTFIVTEDEALILMDGSTQGGPKLVTLEGWNLGPIKIVRGIQIAVTQEFIS